MAPNREQARRRRLRRLTEVYDALSVPVLATFLLDDRRIHPSYRLSWRRRFRLVRRMWRNNRRIPTGTSFRAHVAMTAKILSVAPSVPGVLVEAGCWKGGTTANLSLVAEITGRQLVVYDSFEGLPAPSEGDRWAPSGSRGAYKGELEEVRANVARWGAVDRCTFRKGWFSDTLPHHTEPIVAAFVDVDHQASMHQCLLGLWPHLDDAGYFFVDEYHRLDYCAVFFSERFWRTYFDRPPPGLMGAGSGVPLGQHFVGPFRDTPLHQTPSSVGWARKDFYGEWDYWPDDVPEVPLPGGGRGDARGPGGWTTTTLSAEEAEANRRRRRSPEREERLVEAAGFGDALARMVEADPALAERLRAHLEGGGDAPPGADGRGG